jgi:hypothetical protein
VSSKILASFTSGWKGIANTFSPKAAAIRQAHVGIPQVCLPGTAQVAQSAQGWLLCAWDDIIAMDSLRGSIKGEHLFLRKIATQRSKLADWRDWIGVRPSLPSPRSAYRLC